MKHPVKLLSQAAIAMSMICSGVQVQAAAVTVDFPSASTTINASAGQYFFRDTHFARETFAGTGLTNVAQLDLVLALATNILTNGATVDFDVLVNGTDVGDISFDAADGTGQFAFSFSFAPIAGNGTYTLELDEKNNVPDGDGSISFARVRSTATLTDGAIPEPSSIALFGLALAAVGWTRRARGASL